MRMLNIKQDKVGHKGLLLQARTQGGGGFTVANEPPWKFQVSFQNQRHARSITASDPASIFRDRSRPCFIACRDDVHSNFNMQAISDRCRACKTARGSDRELADCSSRGAVRAGHFGAKQ